MNVNKSIVLVDKLMGTSSSVSFKLEIQSQEITTLDPVVLFSESDWTRFEDDVDVINKIYGRVFNEVVLEKKKLICFWPLSEQLGGDWVSLNSLCKRNSYELEIYKCEFFNVANYGFSGEILRLWKKFVYFLIESLMEDIDLSEEFEEIATLTYEQDSIVLFKLVQKGKELYTFAVDGGKHQLDSNAHLGVSFEENLVSHFESFQDMLVKLLSFNDLSLYQTKFFNPQLEKTYFNILAKKFETKNLIESWILTYSMN